MTMKTELDELKRQSMRAAGDAADGPAPRIRATLQADGATVPAEGPAAPEKPGFLARASRFFRRKS